MFKEHRYLLGVAAVVLLFAGCKGESPTAPSTSTTPTTSTTGTTPPATGASVSLSVSNPSPLVNSTSVVTATVTENGQPVPNGTAVEFRTTLGTFTEGNAQTIIRTTTNGIATVTLTAATVGTATITATVGSVAKTASVAFQATPVTPIPVDTTPTISSVTPGLGRPQGGEVLTINGTNFVAPVRVIFDFGGGVQKEATIISVTSTQIQVLTPGVDLGAGQQAQATIIVINRAGTSQEQRITSTANAFTFQATVLTPKITTVSPASGPIDGGTRVTIFGSGFQSPAQVFFGSAEAQVINVTFDQIVVLSPTARDTSPTASGTVTGFVDIRVVNINSATSVTAPTIFRYIPKMQITAVSPGFGPSLGGTDIKIDGTGFNDPLQVFVTIAGRQVAAQVLRVSGTEVLARTGPLESPCASGTGTITVVNVDNGDTATSTSSFLYVAVNPLITGVTGTGGTVVPGSGAVATVLNPGVGLLGTGTVTGTFADKSVVLSPTLISTGTGSQTFGFAIPSNLTGFNTQACTNGGIPGTQQIATFFPFTFTNTTTSCSNTLSQALLVTPSNPACVTVPVANIPTPGCVTTPVSTAASFSINVSNATPSGGQSLNITSVSTSGPFTVAPTSATNIAPGNSTPFTVTFNAPATPGTSPGTITFNTNDPARPTVTVPLCGNATP